MSLPKKILVKCPNCRTKFVRIEKLIAAGERCGICVKDVVMVPAPITKKERKAVLGAIKKRKKR